MGSFRAEQELTAEVKVPDSNARQGCWLAPVIPALKRLRQKDSQEFKVSLYYTAGPSFKTTLLILTAIINE